MIKKIVIYCGCKQYKYGVMRMIQTFWTAGQDPLKNGFGWSHAKYNLMSWALSCFCLRKHYDEVELYTDSVGYHILIEVLGLPYTKCYVVFDDFKCLPHHWALSKIKTYSMQVEPFIHVDGDVYLSKSLDKEVLNAPLVAQNKEIGTEYYRRMLDNGLLYYSSIQFPNFITERIKVKSVESYNMGFFGGSDLKFIHSYCSEVFKFMNTNRMNEKDSLHSMANCNVFMEQIFFAAMSNAHKKTVCTITKHSIKDNGYLFSEYCDLYHYYVFPFFHILGGHKRKEQIQSSLSSLLLKVSDSCYERILSMFPEENVRYNKRIPEETFEEDLSIERCIARYEDYVNLKKKEYRSIPLEELINIAKRNVTDYGDYDYERQGLFKTHPYISFFEIPPKWQKAAIKLMLNRLNCESSFPLTRSAMIPTIEGIGYLEIGLMDEDFCILQVAKNASKMKNIIKDVIKIYHKRVDIQSIQNYVYNEFNLLVRKGVIIRV